MSFEAKRNSELKENVINVENYKLLRSLVVYGANSSGKSNLIKAFNTMKFCVLSSVKLNETDTLEYTPFLLSVVSAKQPTFFEIIFILENQTFRYGFEYSLNEIVNEWLFKVKKTKSEDVLFIRTKERIAVSDKFSEGKGKEASTNNNRLFLSLVAQLGGETSKQILKWLDSDYNVLSGVEHKEYSGFSLKMFDLHSKESKESLSLFKNLQLGFKNVEVIKSDFNPTNLPKDMPSNLKEGKMISLNTVHNVYDKKGKAVDTHSWDKDENESEGTKKIMDLSGPIFNTLINGKILIIDELDSKLHPLITIQIINLFNNPETNPNGAQLLFATHDTNLLSTDIFRRDQIWFTEKDEVEQTDLYSLDDFVFPDGTKVRKDANLEKNYITGRYGAIPYIANL